MTIKTFHIISEDPYITSSAVYNQPNRQPRIMKENQKLTLKVLPEKAEQSFD